MIDTTPSYNDTLDTKPLPRRPERKPDYSIITDSRRHLVTLPYTLNNLHDAAQRLGIKRCWLHGGSKAHYDVPLMIHRNGSVYKETLRTTTKNILLIIQGKITDISQL